MYWITRWVIVAYCCLTLPLPTPHAGLLEVALLPDESRACWDDLPDFGLHHRCPDRPILPSVDAVMASFLVAFGIAVVLCLTAGIAMRTIERRKLARDFGTREVQLETLIQEERRENARLRADLQRVSAAHTGTIRRLQRETQELGYTFYLLQESEVEKNELMRENVAMYRRILELQRNQRERL